MAQSLETGIQRAENSPDEGSIFTDLRQGLAIIRSRTEALGRFMSAYTQLARLPQPSLASVEFGELVRRVAALERRVPVDSGAGR